VWGPHPRYRWRPYHGTPGHSVTWIDRYGYAVRFPERGQPGRWGVAVFDLRAPRYMPSARELRGLPVVDYLAARRLWLLRKLARMDGEL